MNHKAVRSALLVTSFMVPCLLSSAAAQDVRRGIEEVVVVVARKQGENLLKTPATVSVVDEEALGQLNVTTADQLSGVVPSYYSMQGTTGTSASFRGLGSTAADPSIESSVSTFVDGVYLGHVRDFVTPLYDVEQIEFIPGTQSTLLGKNTSIGAVSIVNRRPGGDFGYDVSGTYASEIEGARIQGGVDIPLGGDFAARVAGLWNEEDGYVDNVFLDRPQRQISDVSGRLALSGPVGGAGNFDFIYQHDERDTDGHYIEPLTDPSGDIAGLGLAVGHPAFDVAAEDASYSGSVGLAPGEIDGPGQFDDQTTDRATLIGTFDLGGGYQVTSHTGYVEWDSQRNTDLDFTLGRLLDLIDVEDNRVLSQEFRISSDRVDPFSYLAGVLYYDNDWALNRVVFAQSAGGALPIEGTQDGTTSIQTQAWSLFASGRFELSERWALLAGLRYTDEEKTATFARTVTGFFAATGAALPLTSLPSLDSSEVDGDAGIQFNPNENTMLYATFARGSKSGGFQSTPDTLDVARFDQEIAYTAEIGAKFDFGSSGSATFAIFNTNVDGFQVSRVQQINGLNQTVIDNADIRTIGAETAFTWRATDELDFSGAVTFVDAEFTQGLLSDDGMGGVVTEVYEGMRLVRAPRWMAKIGAEYETAISARLTLRANTLLRYASESDLQLRASNPLAPQADEHTILDVQVAVGAPDRTWEVALIGNNLTDDRYVTFTSDAPLSDGGYYGTLNRPRTIGLQLRIAR